MKAVWIALLGLSALAASATAAADRDALWHIVHDRCVPEAAAAALAPPCEAVTDGGAVAVIKDRVGVAQLLVLPTARVSGIEDPVLLSPGQPGLWAAAWRARALMWSRLGRALPRDAVGLAVNSAAGRSQDQLHIHVDCLRPELRDQLRRHAAAIGTAFSRPGIVVGGHSYRVRRLDGAELDGRDPVSLVAEGVAGARDRMGRHTILLAGAVFPDGRAGFYLLDDRADPPAGDLGHAEELLDHDCAVAR